MAELSRKRMQLCMTRYINRIDNDNRTAHKVTVHIGSNSPTHFAKLQIAVAKHLTEDYGDEDGKIHIHKQPTPTDIWEEKVPVRFLGDLEGYIQKAQYENMPAFLIIYNHDDEMLMMLHSHNNQIMYNRNEHNDWVEADGSYGIWHPVLQGFFLTTIPENASYCTWTNSVIDSVKHMLGATRINVSSTDISSDSE